MLLWGVEEDVTLHLHSLEMPLHSCFFPVPPPGPWIKAASDTPRAQAERRDAFPGRRKEESSHIQLGCSRQAQSHVLPSISSSPARAVTPMVHGWGGERGFPRPRLCPTAAPLLLRGRQQGSWGATEVQEAGLTAQVTAGGHNPTRSIRQEQGSTTSSFWAIGLLCGRAHVWLQLSALSQRDAYRLGLALWSICIRDQTPQRSRWGWQMCYTPAPVLAAIRSDETQPCVRIGFGDHC